jgi:hypothetical protein
MIVWAHQYDIVAEEVAHDTPQYIEMQIRSAGMIEQQAYAEMSAFRPQFVKLLMCVHVHLRLQVYSAQCT